MPLPEMSLLGIADPPNNPNQAVDFFREFAEY
jgi:hypothetical protein